MTLRLPAPIIEVAGIDSLILRLFEQIEDVLAEGHRALIFSQFTSFLQRISDELTSRGAAHLYLDGSVPMSERADLVT